MQSREAALRALREHDWDSGSLVVPYLDKVWWADKEVVLAVVRHSGLALQHADPALRADKDVVMAAVSSYGSALAFAEKILQADKEVVMAAVNSRGHALEYADSALKADRDVVLAAARTYNLALDNADPALTADRDVVLEAVKLNGLALAHADAVLRADMEVVYTAIEQNPRAVVFVHEDLESDVAFVKGMLAHFPDATFKDVLVFNVAMVSGRSTCFLIDTTDWDYEGREAEEMREFLLETCALRFELELEYENIFTHGQLLDAVTFERVPAERGWQNFECGRMHDLQLVWSK